MLPEVVSRGVPSVRPYYLSVENLGKTPKLGNFLWITQLYFFRFFEECFAEYSIDFTG